MKLSIQRFIVFTVISFSLLPAVALSADRVLLSEDVLRNDTLFAFQCFVQEETDRQIFAKKGMSNESILLCLAEDFRQLRAEEARQAAHLSAVEEEMAAIEERQRQEKAAKEQEILRQRAALLATVTREMSAGWSSKPGNTSWR